MPRCSTKPWLIIQLVWEIVEELDGSPCGASKTDLEAQCPQIKMISWVPTMNLHRLTNVGMNSVGLPYWEGAPALSVATRLPNPQIRLLRPVDDLKLAPFATPHSRAINVDLHRLGLWTVTH